jgi:hypothetical protein
MLRRQKNILAAASREFGADHHTVKRLWEIGGQMVVRRIDRQSSGSLARTARA